ncbi:MAG: hypothetical protein BGO95_03640 [Micrococcales bacterium 73-13]|nr:MAG: hypothetical protein BGO95_03640 [Micrococcales bacterium 73-13]
MDAYPVPFAIDRSRAPRLRIVNTSGEALRWIRVEMRGPGLAMAPLTPRLRPGAALDVLMRGDDLGRRSRVCVRWLRPNGEEYLWGVAL